MPQSRTRFFYHFVWATWQRTDLVTDAIERRLYRCIESEVVKVKGTVLGINGMPDHVHLAVQLPGSVAPAQLMHGVKGVSSTFARDVLVPGKYFGWQDRYFGASVCTQHIEHIVAYIKNQKQHHAKGTVVSEWEPSNSDEDM